jgi:hypothetical protein
MEKNDEEESVVSEAATVIRASPRCLWVNTASGKEVNVTVITVMLDIVAVVGQEKRQLKEVTVAMALAGEVGEQMCI